LTKLLKNGVESAKLIKLHRVLGFVPQPNLHY